MASRTEKDPGDMKSHKRFKLGTELLFGLACLLWFIFRTGSKPSRIIYPCQRAAAASSSALLGLSVPLLLISASTRTKTALSKSWKTLILVYFAVTLAFDVGQFLTSSQPTFAVDPNQEIELAFEPRNASFSPASNVYVVNTRQYAHIDALVSLMGSEGLLFYKSDTSGPVSGPNGLIARDDVVLIKINEEWPQRGGTNTDILKELIQAVMNHPDGFVGEVVVSDNGQWQGSMDWPQSNAEDTSQSAQDVVNTFSGTFNVSTFRWMPIRGIRVDEYSVGDMDDGYVRNDTQDTETEIRVSYPKFRTQFGTYVSFKHGI